MTLIGANKIKTLRQTTATSLLLRFSDVLKHQTYCLSHNLRRPEVMSVMGIMCFVLKS